MTNEGMLVKLSESGKRVAAEGADINGRTVRDADGEEVGTVDDLLIDPDEDVVRFLVVASGGVLGIGKETSFIPVEAVRHVDDEIHIDLNRGALAGAPGYDPLLVPDRTYYDELYRYYGYAPYWVTGFVPPYRMF